MKYLKSFNEELKSTTYKSAARKLKKLGHLDRSKELSKWGDEASNRESNKRWQKNIEDYSKFGKFKLKITNPETKQSMVGEFYLSIYLEKESFEDELESMIDDGRGYIWMPVNIIPVDEETLNKCIDNFSEPDYYNGSFPGLSITLSFNIDKAGMDMEFTKYILESYDPSLSGDIKIADRASAGRLKRLLVKIFSEKELNYPSGYLDSSFYDMIHDVFGAEFGLSTDFGFSPELVASYIKSLSVNEMY